MTMTPQEIEKYAQRMVAQGIDCTQWAQTHGIAMTSTATRSESPKARAARLAMEEHASTALAYAQRRVIMAAAGQLHAPHEYNNGKSDTQRMSNQNLLTNGLNSSATLTLGSGNLGQQLTVSPNWGGNTHYVDWNTAAPVTSGYSYVARPLFDPSSQEPKVVISGKQFVIVCNGRVEYEDTKDKAQAAAERLAHANQQDAFILKPVSRTAPKRDVVTTEIKL